MDLQWLCHDLWIPPATLLKKLSGSMWDVRWPMNNNQWIGENQPLFPASSLSHYLNVRKSRWLKTHSNPLKPTKTRILADLFPSFQRNSEFLAMSVVDLLSCPRFLDPTPWHTFFVRKLDYLYVRYTIKPSTLSIYIYIYIHIQFLFYTYIYIYI